MATTELVKEQVTDNVPKRIKELKFGVAASQDILKQGVLECGGANGRVKKNGAGPLKVTHERFSHFEGSKALKKVAPRAKMEFDQSFDAVKKSLGDIERNLKKAFDDLNPLRILNIFEKISDPDCELLGMNPTEGRPEMFIWKYFPVAPVCLRPSVAQDSTTTEDDITQKLAHIISMNNMIKRGLENGERVGTLMEQWDFLQAQVAMIVNSEGPGVTPSGQYVTMRGFCQRLKGKQGRFRGNLSGKRVDFSGRTVISPDPNIGVNEVAIPEAVAKTLTFPEKVSQVNIEKMRQAVLNASRKWPGASQIVKAGSGFKQFLKFGNPKKHAEALKVGDIVERHLVDGDVVLFNRQPSLHKLSIMAHRVRVRPSRTFRLNECVCTPYNADFDGDEMNLHVPQTEEARAEALELMGVEHNLATPRNGEPIIAAIQDFITGAFLLSNKDQFFDRKTFSQLCSYMVEGNAKIHLPPPSILKPVMLWTGKQVFNVLLRPSRDCNVRISLDAPCREYRFNSSAPRDMSETDGWLCIRDSEIMCGVMDKSTIGAGKKDSIFCAILRDFGEDEALSAMNRLARLISRYLSGQGFSIGISDVRPGEKLSRDKQTLVEKAYADCDGLISRYTDGSFERKKGSSAEQTLEKAISDVLTRVRKEAGDYCFAELNKHNTAMLMAKSGAKGSSMNVSQMVAVVGQQIINQQRVQEGFQDRTLPHYPNNARQPPSKGFVRNSFYTGLSPSELFFHAMSGREGLVDTAVKTAETGYMSRRLMKSLEDLSIKYDKTVRNSAMSIVQFQYGDDSLDPTSMESEARPVNFEHAYTHSMELVHDNEAVRLLPSEILEVSAQRLDHHRQQLARSSLTHLKLPSSEYVTYNDETNESDQNYLRSIQGFLDMKARNRSDLDNRLGHADSLHKSRKRTQASRLDSDIIKQQTDRIAGVSQSTLIAFIETCMDRYHKASVQPGTAVGAVGAQSIGEPGTQMTLKTFHFAGIANLQITQGVPRMKEIINASREISTPIIACQLINKHSMHTTRETQGRIVQTYLRDIVEWVEEVWADDMSYVEMRLDTKTKINLCIDIQATDIKDAILKVKKLRLTPDDITVFGEYIRISTKPPYKTERTIKVKSKDETQVYARMQHICRHLPNIPVCGYAGASRAIIKMDEKRENFSLLVEGYGLKKCLNTDGVDAYTTRTNSILETREVLGIEAARTTIIDEIRSVMDGMGIDPRHMQLLADVMTYRGEVLGITRFGLSKMRDSVLQLASFEKTPDHLFEAAWHAKRDKVEGVSECIIFGQSTGQGTGAFEVVKLLDLPTDSLNEKKAIFEDTWEALEVELMRDRSRR
ncbi:uncharacterized protein KY384_005972 [Bacidia gigantensis]|uniref:uncharacterized protein n=1 Tax=Bacidia gigantensis TaxID=2732470 RepID=UPI001D0446AB|nr:uncharacterized protein KY384_005972 [Bacidia gigantensis]KAG8529336.1 hypothetical protein KY384_005972 [Bacidia gigantensis]